MIEVAIMIEGQNGLTWPRWQRLAKAVDDLGFAGLYRSDHYTNASPPDKESLELWTSLTWLASHTERIEFGPMVTPLSFRDPAMTARMAAAVDDLSGGRLILGLGAGWQEREHTNYGWDLLDVPGRFARFEEGLEIIIRLLGSDTPSDFAGEYYSIQEGILLPRPQRPGGPPILIGGNGPKRTLPLVTRYASEWNSIYLPVEKFNELNAQLDELLAEGGRQPSEVRRSMMTGCEFGVNNAEVKKKVKARTKGKLSPKELHGRGLMVGTANEIVEQLGELAEAGLQRVMLQWLDLDDVDGLEALAKGVLPQ
ncbi:MAG: TIGR03560 family F420-dependent LLM class oxidoreductase [Anaerolineales bacterium]|nr:TIGR03560 family F420-dependent LLM class oxidoreductase [Anaerolineales bacterium]